MNFTDEDRSLEIPEVAKADFSRWSWFSKWIRSLPRHNAWVCHHILWCFIQCQFSINCMFRIWLYRMKTRNFFGSNHSNINEGRKYRNISRGANFSVTYAGAVVLIFRTDIWCILRLQTRVLVIDYDRSDFIKYSYLTGDYVHVRAWLCKQFARLGSENFFSVTNKVQITNKKCQKIVPTRRIDLFLHALNFLAQNLMCVSMLAHSYELRKKCTRNDTYYFLKNVVAQQFLSVRSKDCNFLYFFDSLIGKRKDRNHVK